jgi:Tfp pilus assembly protein PilV
MKKLNSAGFTLVELMIAGTLASVIILGLANYFADSILFQKS